MPAVAARANCSPSVGGGLARLGVEIPHAPRGGRRRNRSGTTTTARTPCAGERLQVVVDVRLQPRHLRRPGARLPDEVELGARRRARAPATSRAVSRCCAAYRPSRRGPDASFIDSGIECAVKTSRASSRTSAGSVASAARTCVDVGGDETRVVEVVPQLDQLRRAVTGDRRAWARSSRYCRQPEYDAGRAGREHQRACDAVVAHLPHRVGDVRLPVAVAPVDRQVDAVRREVRSQRGDQRAVLRVDRRHAAEVLVVLGDLGQPLVGHAAAAGDVAQERHDVVVALRAAEGQEQQGVVRHVRLRPPSRGSRRRRGSISPVVAGNQSDSSASGAAGDRLGVRRCPSRAAPARPTRPRTARSRGCSWPPSCGSARRRSRLTRMLAAGRARARGSATVGLEPGLGHAHPVVGRPGDAGVEGRARRSSRRRRRTAAASPRPATSSENADTCTAVATSSHGASRKPPPRQDAGANPIECSTPSRPSTCSRTRSASESRCSWSATSSSTTGAGSGSFARDPLDQRHPAEAGEHDLRALLLREPGDRERDRGVGDDAGDQQPLAVEQCPIVRSPSRGRRRPGARRRRRTPRRPRRGRPRHRRPRPRGRTGRAGRRRGSPSRRASASPAVMSVSMKPGAITFAVIDRLPSSRAIERASPIRPALLAA